MKQNAEEIMNFKFLIFNGMDSKNNSKFKIKHSCASALSLRKLNCFAFSKLNIDINSFEFVEKLK